MKRNLLLVDDELDLSLNMKELLEDEVRQIFIAANGFEALKILQNESVDCVVTDIKMPVLDGFSLMEEARTMGFEMPFIFYSGHGSTELRKKALSMGAFDLFTKPNFDKLELAIKIVMEK